VPDAIATPDWLVSLLEQHYDELQMLWELRCAALNDADYTASKLAELEMRIEAHTDALVIQQAHSAPILIPALAAEERFAAFAAAYPLLCMNDSSVAHTVLEAFASGVGDALLGFRDALCHGPLNHTLKSLQQYATGVPSPLSAIAAEVLLFHGQLSFDAQRWNRWTEHADPSARRSAWRQLSFAERTRP
jgi:hypothetical protein